MVNLAYSKSERGTQLTWIGVSVAVDVLNKVIVLQAPTRR